MSASILIRDREEALFLAMRTCVMHGAGPLRAIADISASVRRGELTRAQARDIALRCAQRFGAVPGAPADRVQAIDDLVEALWC